MASVKEKAQTAAKNWFDGNKFLLATAIVLIELGLALWFYPFAIIGLGFVFFVAYLWTAE